MSQTSNDEKTKKEGLFEGLSLSQVAAGALAAVTSMLLASQIGIYGSVIGVAVGSVVSAVASQLYKKFLVVSAEKLRDLPEGLRGTGVMPATDNGTDEGETAVDDADKTVPLAPTLARRSPTPRVSDPALREDVAVRRTQETRERKRRAKRRVLAVSVVSALAAVAVSAVVISLATTGEGLGSKEPAFVPSPSADRSSSDGKGQETSANAPEKTEANKSDASASTQDGQGQDTSGGATDGTTGAPEGGQDTTNPPDTSGDSGASDGTPSGGDSSTDGPGDSSDSSSSGGTTDSTGSSDPSGGTSDGSASSGNG